MEAVPRTSDSDVVWGMIERARQLGNTRYVKALWIVADQIENVRPVPAEMREEVTSVLSEMKQVTSVKRIRELVQL